MPRISSDDLPAPLARFRARLDSWREAREGRCIPEDLWSEAAELAREHGIHRTSRALRLNYNALRDRVTPRAGGRAPSPPRFVDLAPSSVLGMAGEGVAELMDADGRVVHIEWKGAAAPDLAAVAAAFLGSDR